MSAPGYAQSYQLFPWCMNSGGTYQGSTTASHIIGAPLYFLSGQFAGQTIRSELVELQQAEIGRKYARVDRRPLDPPPVVLLRLFRVYDNGPHGRSEKEMNYKDVQTVGLICAVDLCPAPSSSFPTNVQIRDRSRGDTNVSSCLVGTIVAEPTLINYQGEDVLVFVYPDLAVRKEGSFLLRYRVFDIFSSIPGLFRPIQAEVYGGVFHVFSTREFPGLQPSTELTKLLARYGVRLTTRDNERRSDKSSRQGNT